MKSKFTHLVFTLFLMAGAVLSAQAQGQKTIDFSGDDYANNVVQISNAYYIVGSTTATGGGSFDAYIAKLDSVGNPIWQKQYGGSGVEYGTYLMGTSDGNLLMVGRSNSYGSNYDVFVVKADLSGNVLWSKTFGTDSSDIGMHAAESPFGYIIVGQSLGAPTAQNGKSDVLAILVDAAGNLKWSETVGTTYANEVAYDVLATGGDGFIIGGYSDISLIGLNEGMLLALDSAGHLQGGLLTGGHGADDVRSLLGVDNSIFLVGNTNTITGGGNANFMVARYDLINDLPVFQWVKNYGGAQGESLSTAQMLPDGNIIMFGLTNSFGTGGDGLVVLIDTTGQVQLAKHYGGAADDYISNAAFGNDRALFVGNSGSFGSNQDVYISFPDTLGNTDCNYGAAAVVATNMPDTSVGPVLADFSADTIHLNAVSRTPASGSHNGTLTSLCPTGINPVAAQLAFSLFPNPASNNAELVFYCDRNSEAVITICNSLGQTVNQIARETLPGRNSITLNVTGYSPGMYLVKIKTREAQGVMPLSVR